MKKEKVSGQDAHSGATQTGPDVPSWVSGKVPHTQRPQDVDGRGYFFKRPFDMLLSFIGLAISSPLWLIFSIAIKKLSQNLNHKCIDRFLETRTETPILPKPSFS